MTDGKGRTVDFKNSLIIMTSNLGSQIIKDLAGDDEKMEAEIEDILAAHFRPEFLNRVDEIVFFKALDKNVLTQIVEIQVEELKNRLKEKEITIEMSLKVKELLAERGWDPVYGARPLKRIIQKDVQNPLALKMLEGEIQEEDVVEIDLGEKGELVFRKKHTPKRKPPSLDKRGEMS